MAGAVELYDRQDLAEWCAAHVIIARGLRHPPPDGTDLGQWGRDVMGDVQFGIVVCEVEAMLPAARAAHVSMSLATLPRRKVYPSPIPMFG